MEEDFVKTLDYLGFATRLKRISDKLILDGRRLYRSLGLEMEPNWFLIFKLLNEHGSLTINQITEKLKFSHPSVITIINKMEAVGYITSKKSDSDQRKRVVRLSPKGIQKQKEFEVIWDAATQGMTSALSGMNALEFIDELESRFLDKDFKQRALESYEKTLK
ncbi:MAG: MarR family transcriptional regulator [Bacteroidota bacterium]